MDDLERAAINLVMQALENATKAWELLEPQLKKMAETVDEHEKRLAALEDRR